jgi:hypothetical protein
VKRYSGGGLYDSAFPGNGFGGGGIWCRKRLLISDWHRKRNQMNHSSIKSFTVSLLQRSQHNTITINSLAFIIAEVRWSDEDWHALFWSNLPSNNSITWVQLATMTLDNLTDVKAGFNRQRLIFPRAEWASIPWWRQFTQKKENSRHKTTLSHKSHGTRHLIGG